MDRSLKAQLMNSPSTSRMPVEDTFCRYAHRDCLLNCVEGYDYCIRHILEDKTAPYKQCTYTTKSGRRCPIAALKQERKDGFCHEHAKKSLLGRQRFSRKRRPKESPETLVEELAHTNSGPWDMINHDNRRGRNSIDSVASKTLEYASSSDSETEAPLVEHTWRDDGDSDAESIDSDQDDMLKYAGIYTTEEVAQILRDKLIRLQALYIDQFKRLRHVLLSKRHKYLRAKRVEQDTYGSIKLYKSDPYQRKKYNKLVAMKRYHKKYGKEALLHRQSTERRQKGTDTSNYKPPTFPQCAFVDEGLQCSARVVPLSKFCQKHILHDPGQVLYRPCPFGDSQCGRPVPTLFNMEFCSLHQRITPLKDPEAEAGETKPTMEEVEIHTADADIKVEMDISSPSLPVTLLDMKMEVEDYKETTKLAGPSSLRPVKKEETLGEDWGDSERSGLFTVGEEEEEEEAKDR